MTVLDAGALVAVERKDQRARLLLTRAAQTGALLIPTIVLTQVWRGGGPRQALLGRFLSVPEVELVPVGHALARAAGLLLGRSGTSDAVDACVVALAVSLQAPIVTSDPDDLRRLDDRVRLVLV